jgi:hypothetical protein
MNEQKQHRGTREDVALIDPHNPAEDASSMIPGWLFSCVMLLWWFGGYGMVVYSVVEDRGPFAFLLHWQSALFGGSNPMVGAVVGGVAFFLGPPFVARRLRRVWPRNALLAEIDARLRRASRTRGELAAESRARWETADPAGRIRIAQRTRNIGLGFAAFSLAAGLAISTWLHITEDADAGKPLTPVTLAPGAPIALSGSSDWVRVTNASPLPDAVLTHDYTIRHHAYRDYYTPLVPAGWHAGERIYLVEQDDTVRHDDSSRNDSRADPAGPLEGELSSGGPREEIAARFQSSGYDVGPWTAVLQRDTSLNGRIPGESFFTEMMVWGEAGLFAVMGLIIALVKQIQIRRIRGGRA